MIAKKTKLFKFIGSPTIRINGKDIQEKVDKGCCVPCEKLVNSEKNDIKEYVKKSVIWVVEYIYIKIKYILIPQGINQREKLKKFENDFLLVCTSYVDVMVENLLSFIKAFMIHEISMK